MRAVTDDSFGSEVLASDVPVVVDFWASWCEPCKALRPVLEEVAGTMEEVSFVALDVDANPNTPATYGVRGLPTLMLFRNGEAIAQRIGAGPRDQIASWISGMIAAQ